MNRMLLSLAVAAAVSLLAGCGDAARPLRVEVNTETCHACHGTEASIAPPRSVKGFTETTNVAVGAHQAHVQDGPLHLALDCSACHLVPSRVDAPGHIDGATASLTFGPLARTGGTAPAWDHASETCSNVYCHGATLAGGTHIAPRWTNVGGGEAACGSCHGLPPTNPKHPRVTATDTKICSLCHPGTVKPDGTIDAAGGLHVDGIVEAGGTCTGCHGDAKRSPQSIAPAPPRDTKGNTDTAARGVGAHQAHLGSSIATPVACSECHVVPSSTDAHPSGELKVTFGPRATANGAAAAWDPSTATCASTWCHGTQLAGGTTTRPLWTKVDGSQRQCASCHGDPPPNGRHDLHVRGEGFACGACHGAGYTSTTTIPSLHVNGVRDVGGTGTSIRQWTPGTRSCFPACHGQKTW